MKDIESTQADNALNKTSTNPRRQFFKKAAVGSAFISTMASRPIWAAGCTVSGQLSGNLSNPDRNDCTGKATGKSPGWWGQWKELYDFFENNPTILFTQLSTGDVNSKFGNGAGASAALYNFAHAAVTANLIANANGLSGWIDLNPVHTNGNISSVGLAINDNGDQEYRHLIAGLLSAAHGGIAYPYPGNEWTVPYIWSKWKGSTEERGGLDDLQRQFIGKHLEPTGIVSAGSSEENRFNWAKNYLGY
jgi:hypothetical protein